jgi:hypothetical protein
VVNASDPVAIEYQLNNGPWQASNAFGGLASGTYDIHVRVQNGGVCVTSWSGNPVVIGPTPVPTATIADQFAVTPGGFKNTIYKNYGQPWLKYTAVVSGGVPPYTYSWVGPGIQNATNKDTVRVMPVQVAGTYSTYTYTVTIMDNVGCTITRSIGVRVQDISCGGNKISLCQTSTTTTICLGSAWAPSYLNNGYTLGACGSNSAIFVSGEVPVGDPAITYVNVRDVFGVLVSPNPSASIFKLLVTGNNNQRISLRVTDAIGRVVFINDKVLAGEVVVIGASFRGGTYFAEVVQGDNKKTVKLVKVN